MSVSGYAYVFARIRARVSDLMDIRAMRELADARKGDFLTLMLESPYKASIEGLTVVDARAIEGALKHELVDEYLMVIRSTKPPVKDFFIELLRRFEVMNVKAILRSKFAGVMEAPLLFPVESFFRRHMSILIDADSLDGAIKRLEDPYRRILESSSGQRLLELETALDHELFDSIWNRMRHLQRRDREIARKVIGAEVDTTNLMILLRCKWEGVAGTEIERYLMPYSYEFEFDAVRDAILTDSVSSAIQLLPDSPYKAVLNGAIQQYEEEKSLVPLELALQRYRLTLIKKLLLGYTIDIATILGYLYLKEAEIRNISTIAVCKENELPAEDTARLLI